MTICYLSTKDCQQKLIPNKLTMGSELTKNQLSQYEYMKEAAKIQTKSVPTATIKNIKFTNQKTTLLNP